MVPGAHIHTEHWARCGSESWLWGQQTQVRIWVLPLKSDVTWAGSAALPRLAPGSSENTHLPQALSWVTGSNGTTRLHSFSGLRTWPASLPYEAGWGSLCSLPAWWVGAPQGTSESRAPSAPHLQTMLWLLQHRGCSIRPTWWVFFPVSLRGTHQREAPARCGGMRENTGHGCRREHLEPPWDTDSLPQGSGSC